MKRVKESNLIIILGALKQIIDLFSGPFLVTFVNRLYEDATIPLAGYYICFYIALALFDTITGRITAKKFHIGLYRIGIVLNILYLVLILFLGEKVAPMLLILGLIAGVSAACYWFPLALIKAEKIMEYEKEDFFSRDRLISTVVAILGPILLGGLITGSSYVSTAFLITGFSVCQLLVTFFFSPIPENPDGKFSLRQAIPFFAQEPKLRQVFLVHSLSGMTINGGALKTAATLMLAQFFLKDSEIGWITSITSILIILALMLYNTKKMKPYTKQYVLACGILPVGFYVLYLFTQSIYVYAAFFCSCFSLLCIPLTVHDINLFSVVGEGQIAEPYKNEYFCLLEFCMTGGRVLSYSLLIIAVASRSDLVMQIVIWIYLFAQILFCLAANRYPAKSVQ